MAERILLVEDEEKLARMVELELQYEGYEVEKAFDGRTGLELALSGKFDLVLLDIMLPALSGMEVLRRLRKESQMPVIMLTARDTVVDKVSGLDMGADDYITKPFAIEELLARIRAALRKKPAQAAEPPRSLLTAGPLTMDTDRHEVTVDGENVELTRREFDLLRYLLENKEKVISRESLLDNVWGFDFAGETNAVDVYIRFLRSKLDERFGCKLIHTVRGVGYAIREERPAGPGPEGGKGIAP
ncbi:MAG TPA: response regulator transcription factor [Candidatus Intestinimonas stercoravium]|nr:response regulator transcription factor [Candidatus Intestinimonas stercoravium]